MTIAGSGFDGRRSPGCRERAGRDRESPASGVQVQSPTARCASMLPSAKTQLGAGDTGERSGDVRGDGHPRQRPNQCPHGHRARHLLRDRRRRRGNPGGRWRQPARRQRGWRIEGRRVRSRLHRRYRYPSGDIRRGCGHRSDGDQRQPPDRDRHGHRTYGPDTACATKADPATDVCQTEVQVTTSQGSSAPSKIRPEFSGLEPRTWGCRVWASSCPPPPSSTTPHPTITSISVDTGLAGPFSLATITGKGLGELGFEWVNVGPYQDATSADPLIGSISGTQLTVILLPPATTSTSRLTLPLPSRRLEPQPRRSDRQPAQQCPDGHVRRHPGGDLNPGAQPGRKARGDPRRAHDRRHEDRHPRHRISRTPTRSDSATRSGSPGQTWTFSLLQLSPTQITLLTPQDNPSIDAGLRLFDHDCSIPLPKNDTFSVLPGG